MKARITTGAVERVPMAAMGPHCTAKRPRLTRAVSTGRVSARSEYSVTANMYSFHTPIKARMPTAMSPGEAMGKIMRQYAPIREQPSTWAASSHSGVISMKNPRIIHVAKGRLKAMLIKTRAVRVSKRFKERKIMYSGIRMMTPGIMAVNRMKKGSICPPNL